MVIWTPRARTDLKDIHDYIAEDSPINAKKVINTMLSKAEPLAELPQLGKVVPELNREDLREITVSSWRILYHCRDNQIFIVTVAHKRRQLEASDIAANEDNI